MLGKGKRPEGELLVTGQLHYKLKALFQIQCNRFLTIKETTDPKYCIIETQGTRRLNHMEVTLFCVLIVIFVEVV